MSDTTDGKVKLTFASDYFTSDGAGVYEGGKTYWVEAPDARLYVHLGKAVKAEQGERGLHEPTAVTAVDPAPEPEPEAAPAAPATKTRQAGN